jgi:hypothetical protein
MKLNGKVLVAMAMVVGALGATGCNKLSNADSGAVAPEDNPATATTVDDEKAASPEGVAADSYWFSVYTGPRYYAPREPPAVRVETRGRAPSERHFWRSGYWRWSGHDYAWMGGRWEPRRDHYEYVNSHWVNRYGRWEYVPGHWVRR